MILEIAIFAVSLLVLMKSSELVIDSSIAISEYSGISQLSIGFILIAISVSIPDLSVSLAASLTGKTSMAIGDVLGSSIANICLVLGVVTLVRKIHVDRKHTLDSAELLLLISIVPAVVLSKSIVGMMEGAVLIVIFILYCLFIVKTRFSIKIKDGITRSEWRKAIIYFIAGMVLVIASAQYLVSSASSLARFLGVSEAVIGLTLVSFGTTLPELAVDFTAIRRGQAALAIGDIIGSTVVNLTLLLGIILLVSPLGGVALGVYTVPLAFIIIANSFLFYSLVKHEGIGDKQGLIFILLYIIFIMAAFTMGIA